MTKFISYTIHINKCKFEKLSVCLLRSHTETAELIKMKLGMEIVETRGQS